MILRLHPGGVDSAEALAEALGRPVSDQEGLTDHTVVAYWHERHRYLLDDERVFWTPAQWAAHLNGDNRHDAFVGRRSEGRLPIWHLSVRLASDDRTLTGPEWSEIAHRLARAAGITRPGDQQGCRWAAVQGQPGRLDLLANLVREDGIWQNLRPRLPEQLRAEARQIESSLQLRTSQPHSTRAPGVTATDLEAASLAGQIDQLLSHLIDEHAGPLARWPPCAAWSNTRHTVSPARPSPTAPRREFVWTGRPAASPGSSRNSITSPPACVTTHATLRPYRRHQPRSQPQAVGVPVDPSAESFPSWPWPTAC